MIDISTTKKTHNRPSAAGSVGFFAPKGIENRIPRVFFSPDNRMPAGIGEKVILYIAVFRISAA